MKTFKSLAVLATALIALLSWGCEMFNEKEQPKAPTITIGEPAFDTEAMTVTLLFTPSVNTTAWYYKFESEGVVANFTLVAGDQPKEIVVPFEYDVDYTVSAYAEGQGLESDLVIKEFSLKTIPTISVSKPHFDEEAMTVSFDVAPSEGTHHWYWGVKDSEYAQYEGDEAQTVSCTVEYGVEYTFLFRVENEQLNGESKEVEFAVIEPVVEIAIENLTAYTLDAVITKKEHCVKYVAGAVHTTAYDRNVFIEQAQKSLNPDPSYQFAVFNSATESRTFSEQDLVRNSLLTSDENAGIILLPKTSYTIAVYGEDAKGNYTVTTKEVEIPEVEINGTSNISIEVVDIELTAASAKVTAEAGSKVLSGYIDPAIAKADTEKPFDFEGKSDEEIKNYIASVVKGVPTIYTEPFTYVLSDRFDNDTEYVAYAIAIKDGKVGEVVYTKFQTPRPSLSGVATITAAVIEKQTSHETLTVQLTTELATKVRLYAAPASDHASYADNMVYIMDSNDYQNYREEYEVVDGVATCVVNIYHPTANYYLYASAVDADGHAGAIVCVAQLAGFETEYYTTIEEIIEESGMDYNGTGSATLSVEVLNIDEEESRIGVALTASNFSDNVDKVWFLRYNGKIDEIEAQVKEAFAEYLAENKIIGSYKFTTDGFAIKYIDDLSSDWNPKREALSMYNASWGGDVIVMVILDTDGKLNIHSYYAAGQEVVVL